MKKLVACYKAYRGGEWIRASLESVRPYTDGAVVVLSNTPWSQAASLPENCLLPLLEFQCDHKTYPMTVVASDWQRQEDQYRIGLETVQNAFGPDAAVLIVDTDEIWPAESLKALCEAMERENAPVFRARIRTYVKSPLYVVCPEEGSRPVVGLKPPLLECQRGRFQGSPRGCVVEEAVFDHFSYVREDPAEILEKFLNTSSQEDKQNDPSWLRIVWPDIPCVSDFHMTPGEEKAWSGIKILTPAAVPQAVRTATFFGRLLWEEDTDWRRRLDATPIEDQLLPRRTWDIDLYTPDLQRHFGPVDLGALRSATKTSYLELLWLAWWASRVPPAGGICEIGCGFGASATTLAISSQEDVMVDAVDPFLPYDEVAARGLRRNNIDGDYDRFWGTLTHYQVSNKVRRIPHLSADAAGLLSLYGYDLVFIDANHSYEHVQHDMGMMWPRVNPGGIMVGHDYTTRFPGVIRAVSEFPHPAAVAAGTSLWYMQKEQA